MKFRRLPPKVVVTKYNEDLQNAPPRPQSTIVHNTSYTIPTNNPSLRMHQQSYICHVLDEPVNKYQSRSMEWNPPPAGNSSGSTISEYDMCIVDGTQVASVEDAAYAEDMTPVDVSLLDPGCVAQPKVKAPIIKVQSPDKKKTESVG
jgi:hypothetical protein